MTTEEKIRRVEGHIRLWRRIQLAAETPSAAAACGRALDARLDEWRELKSAAESEAAR